MTFVKDIIVSGYNMKNNKNNSKFFYQGFLLWILILLGCFILGAFDDLVLFPLVGKIAISITGIFMCIVIFTVAWIFLPKLIRGTAKNYWLLGIIWFIMTFLFESIEAIVLEGSSWQGIVAAYNPFLAGNLWILVMFSMLIAPWIIAKIRKLIVN